MRQSRIDNSEILAELGTQDTGRRQKKLTHKEKSLIKKVNDYDY
jgi:hypothetical protein